MRNFVKDSIFHIVMHSFSIPTKNEGYTPFFLKISKFYIILFTSKFYYGAPQVIANPQHFVRL